MSVMWTVMLVASLILMIINNPAGAVNAMIEGANGAVTLSINLLALYAFWLGLFNIIERLGVSRALDRLLAPVINKLFPGANSEARKYITMNISANLLGLGNAATPMAINAIGALDDGSKKANVNMIMLTVISATSLQLLPTTIIGLRASYGSANPADFLFPSLIATIVSTAIGIILVKLISRLECRFKGVKTHDKVRPNDLTAKQPLRGGTLSPLPSENKTPQKPLVFSRKSKTAATSPPVKTVENPEEKSSRKRCVFKKNQRRKIMKNTAVTPQKQPPNSACSLAADTTKSAVKKV